MNKTIKKIFAREFLVLLCTVVVFIITTIVLLFISDSNDEKEWALKEQIHELTAPKEPPYRLNLYYYINEELIGPYGEGKIEDRESFISALHSDKEYTSHLYDWMLQKGYRGNTTKAEYLERIIEDTDSEKYLEQLMKVEYELKDTEKSLDFGDDQDVVALMVSLFSFTFLLRYLYYATRWSVKELKAA